MPAKKANAIAKSMFWTVLVFFMSVNQACSADLSRATKPTSSPEHRESLRAPRGQTITVPKDTQAVLTLSADGKIRVTDLEGNKFVPCILCPTEYVHKYPNDPHCKGLRKRLAADPKIGDNPAFNICGNRLSINSLASIAIMQTHLNPDCSFIQALGTVVLNPNDAAMLEYVRQVLAEVYGLPPEQVDAILGQPDSNCYH